MTVEHDNADARPRRWLYTFAVATPVLLAVLRVVWTFEVLDRYAASREPYSLERATEWYRLAFTQPEATLAVLLLLFVILVVALPSTSRRGVIAVAIGSSVAAFFLTVIVTFNSAFANFKEIVG